MPTQVWGVETGFIHSNTWSSPADVGNSLLLGSNVRAAYLERPINLILISNKAGANRAVNSRPSKIHQPTVAKTSAGTISVYPT